MSRIKELLKNKKVVAGASLALILVVAVVASAVYWPDKPPELPVAESSSTASGGVTVNIPEPLATESDGSTTATTAGTALIVDVKGDPNGTTTSASREKAKTPDAPVATAKPAQPEVGGIQIGGGEQPQEKYNCKTPNHHCINTENHAYIENLEIQGCPYCGSHSCKSFYYVSSAGIPICNAALCPKYNEKQDPIEYCQVCGKKNGDGDDNTCQKWIVDFTCPKCGQLVKANECHTHK